MTSPTNLERWLLLSLAFAFTVVQMGAVFAMAALWVVAGYWSLVGLAVILPACWPVIWLLRSATKSSDEVDRNSYLTEREFEAPEKQPRPRAQRPAKPDELAEARMRRDAAMNGGAIDLNTLDKATVEAMFKGKKRIG